MSASSPVLVSWYAWSVHVYLLANSELDSAVNKEAAGPGRGIRQARVCAGIPRGLANMACLWYERVSAHMFTSEHQTALGSV